MVPAILYLLCKWSGKVSLRSWHLAKIWMKGGECPGRPLGKEPSRQREWSAPEFWVGVSLAWSRNSSEATCLNLDKEREGGGEFRQTSGFMDLVEGFWRYSKYNRKLFAGGFWIEEWYVLTYVENKVGQGGSSKDRKPMKPRLLKKSQPNGETDMPTSTQSSECKEVQGGLSRGMSKGDGYPRELNKH